MTRYSTPSVVNVILQNLQGQVLMLKRSGIRQEWGLPAGKLDQKESLRFAACRELREETGIFLPETDLKLNVTLHYINKLDGWEDFQFFFGGPQRDYRPSIIEPLKHEAFEWVYSNSLPEATILHVAAGIEAWSAGVSYVEYGWETRAV